MFLLRQPPFPLTVEYSGLTPSTNYILEIYDDRARLMYSFDDIVSDGSGVVTKELPEYYSKFDGTYSLYIYSIVIEDSVAIADEVVVVDTLTVKRPYVNPLTLGSTQAEIEQAIYNERIARNIIDSITGGFYYKEDHIELTALGGDFLAIPNRINRLNQVYRNNVKVYDRITPLEDQDQYYITANNTAITISQDGEYNRLESRPVVLPLGASDSFNLYSDTSDPVAALTRIREFDLFPNGFDYVIGGEFGWPVVPQDIQDASNMLINDIACNKLNYVSRYISEYQTDQFKIKYSDLATRGTGNMVVDNILAGYQTNFYKIGVL